MFLRLPRTLALILAASVTRASFISTESNDGQVVIGGGHVDVASLSSSELVDEYGRETYEGYSVVRFDIGSEEKRKELVRLGQVSLFCYTREVKARLERRRKGRERRELARSLFSRVFAAILQELGSNPYRSLH